MARWLVGLEGERFDNEEFPYWFPNGEVHAVQLDEEVFLAGDRFEQLSEATEVHEAAQTAIDELFAVISLFQSNLVRPQISAVIRERDDGTRQRTVFGAATMSARSKARLSGSADGKDEQQPPETQAQTLLRGVRRDTHLDTAVLLWADPQRSWPRLYRILEETELYLKEPVSKAGLCSNNEREDFTHSANDPAIAGRDARHAKKLGPPKRPMDHAQACHFVSTMLRLALSRAAATVQDIEGWPRQQ